LGAAECSYCWLPVHRGKLHSSIEYIPPLAQGFSGWSNPNDPENTIFGVAISAVVLEGNAKSPLSADRSVNYN
jgi:hypothetical protein